MKTAEQKQAEEQINRLDRRLGEGIGVKKDRTQLGQRLGMLMCGHHYHPVRHPYFAIECLEREGEELHDERENRAFERTNEPDDY